MRAVGEKGKKKRAVDIATGLYGGPSFPRIRSARPSRPHCPVTYYLTIVSYALSIQVKYIGIMNGIRVV